MLLDSVNNFILYCLPEIPQDRMFRGYENRNALPPVQDYVVYAIASTARIGTNVNTFAQGANDDTLTTNVLREYAVDVDFFSSSQETAQQRAAALEAIARCYIGVDFFNKDNIGLNYADDTQYLPYVDLTEQYVHRYRVTLHLTVWEAVTVNQQYANEVVLQRVENVDAHHKP